MCVGLYINVLSVQAPSDPVSEVPSEYHSETEDMEMDELGESGRGQLTNFHLHCSEVVTALCDI